MKAVTIILLSGLLSVIACKDNTEEKTTILPQEAPVENVADAVNNNDKMCFLKVVEGNDKNRVIRDSIIFEMERKGDSIYGIFDWKPYEKDTKISTYRGIINGKTGTAIAHYKAEGMEYDEELVFTLGEDQVSVIYGEMTEGDDDIWRYKNKEASSVQVLNKVDCKN